MLTRTFQHNFIYKPFGWPQLSKFMIISLKAIRTNISNCKTVQIKFKMFIHTYKLPLLIQIILSCKQYGINYRRKSPLMGASPEIIPTVEDSSIFLKLNTDRCSQTPSTPSLHPASVTSWLLSYWFSCPEHFHLLQEPGLRYGSSTITTTIAWPEWAMMDKSNVYWSGTNHSIIYTVTTHLQVTGII